MVKEKKNLSWKNKDHLFTSINITIDEKLSAEDIKAWRVKTGKCKLRPKALRHGRVIWIIKGGEVV